MSDPLGGMLAPVAGAAGGAALGTLAGVGPIAGALGGMAGMQDLTRAYEQRVQRGEQLGFMDFLKATAKGAGAAGLAGLAKKALKTLETGKESPAAEPEPEDTRNFMERAREDMENEGIDFFRLSGPRKQRVGILLKRLRDLQEEGKGWDHRSVRAVRNKIGEFSRGEGLSLIEQEEENVEKQKAAAQAEEPRARHEEVGEIAEEEVDVKPVYTGRAAQLEPETQEEVAEWLDVKDPFQSDKPLTRDVKPIQGLKSSNVRYAAYYPEEQRLQILFDKKKGQKGGAMYEYHDVPKEDVDKMLEGSDTAVTTGESQFRAWYTGKHPSIGAAFDEFIKQRDDEGEYKYPYRQIDESEVTEQELIKVRNADKVASASLYFDQFDKLVSKAKAKQKAPGLKMMSDTLKDMDDNMVAMMLFEVQDELKKELKATPKKRFKGGREKEILRRVEERAGGRT